MENNKLILFQGNGIRRKWHNDDWYYSIVDIVGVLTESEYQGARNYWKVLKSRLKEEGNQSVTNCNQLKLQSSDGKYYNTDVANSKEVFRLIQSIPSPKAEPFKEWLAQVGSDRLDEIVDPELAIKRAKETFEKKGYDDAWINQRVEGIKNRNILTNTWKERGAKGIDYAILTNEVYKSTFDLTAEQYKDVKGISKTKRNLRDSMNPLELALTNLAEVASNEMHIENDSTGVKELKSDVKTAGSITNIAKTEFEKKLGHSIVSKDNYRTLTNKENKRLK